MTKTKSGKHTIFDLRSFKPGTPPPADWKDSQGPWHYMPSDWTSPGWGGTAIAARRDYPICYSIGHETEAEALADAEEWEQGQDERDAAEAGFTRFMTTGTR